MVAVVRHQESTGQIGAVRNPLPAHLLEPKRSPIAQRLAQQEADRVARSRRIARQRTTVDQNLRLVIDRPLFETARPAGRAAEEAGLVDAYVRRMNGVRQRALEPTALISQPIGIGRSTSDHYRRLQAEARPSLNRLRVGSISGGWNLHLSGRMAIASLAALVIMLSAVGTSFAQQRYEVQEGDTLASIAETFGVDPNAISASSYMPDGETVSAGQVLVIPDVGQSPAEASAMAAELEGTSPFVVTAHVVEFGDTLDSIGAPYGVSGATLQEFNAVEDVANLLPGSRILIPLAGNSEGDVVAPAVEEDVVAETPSVVTIPNVPTYKQSRNLSCEYAATYIATAAFGNGIPENVMIDAIPVTLNPHYGYRGNIDGFWGNTDDYGIYPSALVPTLNSYGFVGDVFYSEGDTSGLTSHIDAGHPVVVWLGLWGDTRERLTDEGEYSVAAGMHVMTVYGYSADGVYLVDPATGDTKYYDWTTFVGIWSVLDGMSMAVYPA
ncbi:MAG: C39 family peptidase [Thermomicrobiales bacterium]